MFICPNRTRFCFVCGLFAPTSHNRKITDSLEKAFFAYFKLNVVQKWYKPNVVCLACHKFLLEWIKHKEDNRNIMKYVFLFSNNKTYAISTHFIYILFIHKIQFSYVVPMEWLHRTEHAPDLCYFCLNISKTRGFHYNTRGNIPYVSVASVVLPTIRSEENPKAPGEIESGEEGEQQQMEIDNDFPMDHEPVASSSREPSLEAAEKQPVSAAISESPPSAIDTSSTYAPDLQDLQTPRKPMLLTEEDYNNIVRDAQISNRSAELIASRLKSRNLCALGFRITMGRKRGLTRKFDDMYIKDEKSTITYCWDIDLLFHLFEFPHNANEWRLFIDGSNESLKAVLLHIKNVHPSVPIAYARKIEESYESMDTILNLIQYKTHNWLICCDLKVVGLLIGLKRGYPTNQCFICQWEGRDNASNYAGLRCAPRLSYQIGKQSIDHLPIINPQNVILPPLHLKLGLVRNFTMAIDRNSDGFKSLKKVFKKEISEEKILNGKHSEILLHIISFFNLCFIRYSLLS